MTQDQIIKLSEEIKVSPIKIQALLNCSHKNGKKADFMDLFNFSPSVKKQARRDY